MAREPLRKEVEKKFRCVDEDFVFTEKVEYLALDAGEEVGHSQGIIGREQAKVAVYCPNDRLHRVVPVEE